MFPRLRVEEVSPDRGPIVGNSAAIREALRQADSVARTDSTVLIHGETGTGKELIARTIHLASARRAGPFVPVNAAAIPSSLMESEFFGHERGAFTGAVARRAGRFEIATNGTIFLDEIGEMDLAVQPKILRVLQEREFERLGSALTLRANVRLIAATNRDLLEMVEEGAFREDLYYRLSVLPIRVPPLRERREDIPLLVNHFIDQMRGQMKKQAARVSPSTMDKLQQYDWPGNVRELQNVVERAMVLSEGPILQVDLPAGRASALRFGVAVGASPGNGNSHGHDEDDEGDEDGNGARDGDPASEALEDVERAHILKVLRKTNWVVAGPNGAAVRLGLKRTTLNFRLKRLGLLRKRSSSSFALTPG